MGYGFLSDWEMVSDYREPYGLLHSTQFLHSATVDRSSELLRSDAYTGRELDSMQHQRLQGDRYELSSHPHHHHPQPHTQFQGRPQPLSSTQSHNLHEAILREIEKESIRQEIIMSEIIRRRALEAEVRYEVVMERAMAIQRGRTGFPSESPRPMGLDMPMRFPLAETRTEGRFLEERTIYPPPPRYTLNNWHKGGGIEAIPFQRASIDERMARHSEVKPVLEASSERNNMILQAKPIESITGAKRARAGSGSRESQSDGNLKKKVKKEWSCALCQISVTSEHTLNMHLEGKKHKGEEAALNARKAGKNSRISLSPNKVAKSPKASETVDPVTNSEVKLTSESLPFAKKGDASSVADGAPPGNLEKDNATEKPQEVQKNGEPKKNEICQVGMGGTWEEMDKPEQVKTHKLQLTYGQSKYGYGIRLLGPSNQKAKTEEQDGSNAQKTDGDNDTIMVDVAEIHLGTDEVVNAIEGSETSIPATDNEVKPASESLAFVKKEDATSASDGLPSLDGKLNSGNLKENKAAVKPQEVQKMDEAKKKAHKLWCEICQIGVGGSHKGMAMHEQGNKHKRLHKSYSVSVVGPSNSSETAKPATGNAVKLASESLPFGKNGDASSARDNPRPLDRNLNSDSLKKDEAVVVKPQVLKNDEPKKTVDDESWCKICQVNMGRTQKSMDAHQQGKKHKRRLKTGSGASAVLPVGRQDPKNKLERM